MNKREMIEALKRDEKDKEEVSREIDALIAEKERQITDLAQREVEQEKRLLDGIERMHADYKREGAELANELNHYLRIQKKFRGELEGPINESREVVTVQPLRIVGEKTRRKWI